MVSQGNTTAHPTQGAIDMTLTTTTWTVATTDSAADYAAYMDRCEAIAEAVGFDFNAMLGTFYNASGGLTSQFNAGYCAYYAGLHRDELPTHEMQLGFDEAHGENQYAVAMVEDYQNEPGYRSAWDWQ